MNILITGTSRGIGKALTEEFAGKDHKVFAVTRGRGSEASGSDRVQVVQFDWQDYDGLAETLKTHLGDQRIDIVINNAGLLLKADMLETKQTDLIDMYKVNALYPLYLTRTLIQADLFAPGAHVINISSMAGYQGASKYPGLGGYSMSKAALVALTECMTAEWGDYIRANCLCLGAVNTEMLKEAFPGYVSEVTDEKMASFIYDFAISASGIMSGKVLPVANSDP